MPGRDWRYPARLQTGLINVVAGPAGLSPLYSQIDKRAPHMIDLKWGPLIGGCVVKRHLDKIPAEAKTLCSRRPASRVGKSAPTAARKAMTRGGDEKGGLMSIN